MGGEVAVGTKRQLLPDFSYGSRRHAGSSFPISVSWMKTTTNQCSTSVLKPLKTKNHGAGGVYFQKIMEICKIDL